MVPINSYLTHLTLAALHSQLLGVLKSSFYQAFLLDSTTPSCMSIIPGTNWQLLLM